jgi:3-oxoacyl-[acyl-carrier-protein] synthase I
MNKDSQAIVISGCAVISPVGLNMEQTGASIRAGITRFTEHAYYECEGEDPEWDETEPLIASSVQVIDPFIDGPERLLQLILPPMNKLFAEAKMRRKDLETGGFLLALPQPDKIIKPWSLEKTFLPEVYERTGLKPFKVHKVNQSGHTGIFSLIQEATTLLRSGEVSFCIVGGVDSYLLEERLEFLDRSWRIKSTKAIDGFIPGEAAALILLERAQAARRRKRPLLAAISDCGFGKESQTIHSEKNSTGKGLAQAIETALQPTGEDPHVQWAICDLNGENYRSFEWGITQTRLPKAFSDIRLLNHPADCIGDVGAATGGILAACAVHALQRGYNIADTALLWTASDDGLRAALCISRMEKEKQEVI